MSEIIPPRIMPSYGARRMAQSTAHLIDQEIGHVPVRQWVLSFPVGLRILFADHPELLALPVDDEGPVFTEPW